MRKLILLSFLCVTLFTCFSQQNQVRIDEYVFPGNTTAETSIVVGMPFGKNDILSITGDTALLRSAGDVMIDIICTDYPASASLDKLNESRVKKLLSQFTTLKEKNIRKINFLRQLDGSTKETAKFMFHGAVIRFRPAQTKETMKKDLEKLEAMLMPYGGDSTNSPFQETPVKKELSTLIGPMAKADSPLKLSEKKSPGTIRHDTLITPVKKSWHGLTSIVEPVLEKRDKAFFPNADSLSIMTPLQAMKNGYIDRSTYDSTYSIYPIVTVYFGPVFEPIFYGDIDLLDSLALTRDSLSASGYALNPNYQLPDSTIFRVFKRNKWKNVMVVGDVTGSMYPYTAQLLLWLKLHSLDDFTSQFAFFNDGNDTPDEEKKLGKTGGIYFKRCYNFEEAKELVKSTMLKGGGGDCPENNIEALLLTEREFPANDYQVLIADNWAPIKDKVLMNKLTKPVRIVLCGVGEYGINVDYLNLARMTKGSVHLMEEDLYQLASMHEGETIKIGRMHFKIVDGEFKEVGDFGKLRNL